MELEEFVYQAKLAQMAGRYEDMFEIMSSAAMSGVKLTEESKDLFSIAYQTVANGKRASLRRLKSVENTENTKGNRTSVRMVKIYHQKVKDELIRLCSNMLDLIDNRLLLPPLVPRSWILLNKKGDGYRILASLKEDHEMKSFCDKSLIAYELASVSAKENLHKCDALKLALDINTGLLFSELMGSPERAHKLAIEAFNQATDDTSLLRDKDTYTETSFMLNLLLDHIEFWEKKMNTVKGTCLFRLVGHTPPKEQRTPISHKVFKGRVEVSPEEKLTVLEHVPVKEDIKERTSYCNKSEISKIRVNIAKVQEKMNDAINRSTHEKLEREVKFLSTVLEYASSFEDTGTEVVLENEVSAGDKGEECAHYYCEQDDSSEPTTTSSKQ